MPATTPPTGTDMPDTGIRAEPVSFGRPGETLRGTLYAPAGTPGALPTIVMAHGWAMVAGGNLDDYARVFAGRGFNALTFDFRNLGKSDGLPRQELDPWRQVEDFRTAISYARSRPDVDRERIGLWGTSYSGGHALVVAAVDKRVRCVVSQVPTINGFENARRRFSGDRAAALRAAFEADRETRFEGAAPRTIQLVDPDPHAAVAYPGEDSYGYMFGESSRCPGWVNEVTLRSLEMARAYEPGSFVPRIAPTPLLMIVAEDDVLTPVDLQQDAFEAAGEPKRLMQVPGGHYSPYAAHFERSSQAAAGWFTEHLHP
ncbi:fermentation-respiration switch protein FrsA (DUF1100 family) [Arthrobacter ginsengisoli]|uniref:Fermentation-respiration switch protein FrsA (DUF1100 family) n=1 Tax=Arthrobacter ginsengisoli TaxID=1356565 RepID=A0ABU1UG96_9MICC|nr:alpha/beta fold hydrolase [Arthrobacter ginsengisoli]MDR7084155.1 fermentation-respiration switch protein FrsA (DUF1100 family) [Arthrobacter ginsengisoli]